MKILFSKKCMIIICIVCSLGGIAIGTINLYIRHVSTQFIYTSVQNVPSAYTALILGAKVEPDGRLSHMLEDRVLTGLDLYQQGKVKKLLLSGDHGRKGYDEVNGMRTYLLGHAVPEQDIFLDHAGFDTYDSIYRARDIFQVRDVIVVTQKFHVTRAVYTARKLGLNAVGIVADRRVYMTLSTIKSDLREILARVKAFLEVQLIKTKPKYLGEVIPITGDGRKTRG